MSAVSPFILLFFNYVIFTVNLASLVFQAHKIMYTSGQIRSKFRRKSVHSGFSEDIRTRDVETS